jgi:hypothetical protein
MHNGAIMASEVAHLVVTGESYPVVRLTGVLDASATPSVRSALLEVLADQPEAVVVDVAGLRVAEPDAVQVLRDLARDTTDWPGAHVVICGADHADVWRGTGLPVWPDRDGAIAALGAPEVGHRLSADLEPVVGAARRSRELATEACARWDCPEMAGPACIVLTEMVNNVVAHAHTPMTVLLARMDGFMTVAVRDRSTTTPRFGGLPEPTAYGGRGLVLIDSVSSRWGYLPLADGKVVWALLRSEPGPPGRGRREVRSAGMADPARG